MRMRYVALVAAALLALAACTQAAQTGAIQEPGPTPQSALYSPISRDALALGLPDLVGSNALHPATGEEIEHEESKFVNDPRVKRILVSHGLGPSMVMVEQKSARISGPPETTEQVPKLALAAAQVKEVPATALVEWDPTFYLLLTSVDVGDYVWQGEKPDDRPVTHRWSRGARGRLRSLQGRLVPVRRRALRHRGRGRPDLGGLPSSACPGARRHLRPPADAAVAWESGACGC